MERISDRELQRLIDLVLPAVKMSFSPNFERCMNSALQELKERRETEKIGICDQCGRDNKILIEQEQIKYCPGCGARLEGGA